MYIVFKKRLQHDIETYSIHSIFIIKTKLDTQKNLNMNQSRRYNPKTKTNNGFQYAEQCRIDQVEERRFNKGPPGKGVYKTVLSFSGPKFHLTSSSEENGIDRKHAFLAAQTNHPSLGPGSPQT